MSKQKNKLKRMSPRARQETPNRESTVMSVKLPENVLNTVAIAEVKVCIGCKMEYPATPGYFHRDGHGLCSKCKLCCLARSKQWRLDNKKKHREYNQRYYKQHLKQCKIYSKQYRGTLSGYLRDVYRHLKQRCNNLKNKRYKDYGGRGIKNRFASLGKLWQ